MGGGISAKYHVGLIIEKSLIRGNSASSRGVGIYSIYSDITVSQSIISDNTVTDDNGNSYGGAVPVKLENCLITGNSASGTVYDEISQQWYPSGAGGAIHAFYTNLLVRNTTMSGNSVEDRQCDLRGSPYR